MKGWGERPWVIGFPLASLTPHHLLSFARNRTTRPGAVHPQSSVISATRRARRKHRRGDGERGVPQERALGPPASVAAALRWTLWLAWPTLRATEVRRARPAPRWARRASCCRARPLLGEVGARVDGASVHDGHEVEMWTSGPARHADVG